MLYKIIMKRVGIIVLVFVFGVSAFSACATMKTTNKALMQEVKAKVAEMQELVKFDDKQARKLEKVELKFLEKKSEIENCKDCDADKLLRELQQKKANQLQRILERHQYIKYDAIENNRIKKGKLMAK